MFFILYTANIASRQQNQTLLASSLQIAFNLRVLPSLVQNLVSDLSHTVDDRIRGAFDLSKISKDVVSKGDPRSNLTVSITSDDESLFSDSGSNPPSPQIYRSRVRTEPTNVTAPQWTAALWLRLEAMFQAMADCCIKVRLVFLYAFISNYCVTLGKCTGESSKVEERYHHTCHIS